MTSQDGHQDAVASGFVCPLCGGALWERSSEGLLRFECRVGDAFSAAELWIEHCAARNTALKRAQRALAENAALARKLAEWARGRGDPAAAIRIEEEAADDLQLAEQIGLMLEGLPPAQDGTVKGPEAT